MEKHALIRLAIADDHTLFRSGLVNLIKMFGNIKVEMEVNNGKELIDKIEETRNTPDVCIIDINMPVMNGYETLKCLKERWPSIKVLVLSTYNNEFAVIKLLKEGANGFLSKNCDYNQLNQAIKDIYYNGYHYSESISGKLIYLLQAKEKNEVPTLTDKELEFLSLCHTKMTYKEIAKILCVSPRTIDKFSKVLFDKLNVNTRTALAAFAFKIGLGFSPNEFR